MERQAINGDFRANVTIHDEGKPITIDNKMEFLSLEAIRLMELDIGGVDLFFDNNGYKICEINSAPSFKGIDRSLVLVYICSRYSSYAKMGV